LAYLRRNNEELSKNKFTYQLKAIGCAFIFVFVSLLVFSPWMIKNYSQTKNPVYPLYNSWFNPIGSNGLDCIDKADTEKDDEIKKDGEWSHFPYENLSTERHYYK
jgi:hypothetical protein